MNVILNNLCPFIFVQALFGQSNRKFSTLLFSGSEEVGTLSAELTLIKPLNSRPDQFMKSGPIWNPDWTGLEIGHCGAGQSYLVDKSANSDILENTILSLNKVRLRLIQFHRKTSRVVATCLIIVSGFSCGRVLLNFYFTQFLFLEVYLKSFRFN